MSVDLDNPPPECAAWARLLEAATVERNNLRTRLLAATQEIERLRGLVDRATTLAREAANPFRFVADSERDVVRAEAAAIRHAAGVEGKGE